MVNGQLVVVKCVTTVLALVQVTQVQVSTAKTHTLLVVEVVFGHSNRRVVNSQAGATSNVVLVFFKHSNPIQKHQFDSMLPVDDAQWQDRNRLVIRV